MVVVSDLAPSTHMAAANLLQHQFQKLPHWPLQVPGMHTSKQNTPIPHKRTNVKTASVLTTEEATPVPNSRPCSSFGLLDRKAQFKLGKDLEMQNS